MTVKINKLIRFFALNFLLFFYAQKSIANDNIQPRNPTISISTNSNTENIKQTAVSQEDKETKNQDKDHENEETDQDEDEEENEDADNSLQEVIDKKYSNITNSFTKYTKTQITDEDIIKTKVVKYELMQLFKNLIFTCDENQNKILNQNSDLQNQKQEINLIGYCNSPDIKNTLETKNTENKIINLPASTSYNNNVLADSVNIINNVVSIKQKTGEQKQDKQDIKPSEILTQQNNIQNKNTWQKLLDDLKLNLSLGFDMLSVNNVKNTNYANKINFKTKYITSDTRIDYNITDRSKDAITSARRTDIINVLSDNRLEINDLDFFKLYNFRDIFNQTQTLKQQKKFQKIDILKYAFVSAYARAVITNEKTSGFMDQRDIIYSMGPGVKYRIFYFSVGYGVGMQDIIVDRFNYDKGTISVSKSLVRFSGIIEKNFKYLTNFDDEIKIKTEVSYNTIKNFSNILQQNISLSKKIDKYSTLNLFYSIENIRYNSSIVQNQNTNRRRISLSFLFNFL